MESLSCDPDLHAHLNPINHRNMLRTGLIRSGFFSVFAFTNANVFYRKEDIFKTLTSFRFFQFLLIPEGIVWIFTSRTLFENAGIPESYFSTFCAAKNNHLSKALYFSLPSSLYSISSLSLISKAFSIYF